MNWLLNFKEDAVLLVNSYISDWTNANYGWWILRFNMSISAIEEEQETVSAINSTQIQTASLTRKLKQKKN